MKWVFITIVALAMIGSFTPKSADQLAREQREAERREELAYQQRETNRAINRALDGVTDTLRRSR